MSRLSTPEPKGYSDEHELLDALQQPPDKTGASSPQRLFPSHLRGVSFKGLPCDDSGEMPCDDSGEGPNVFAEGASLRASERLSPSAALETTAESADVQDAGTARGSGESCEGEEGKEGETMRKECLQECLWRCEEVLGHLQLQNHHISPICKTKLMMSLAPSLEEDEAQKLMHLRCTSAVGDAPSFFSPDLRSSISVTESAALAADCLPPVPSTVGMMLVGVRVERLLPLGPAFEANLEIGDTILTVDDRLVSAGDIVEGLRGTPHQPVRLKVQKACGSTVMSTLTRMPILRGQVAEIKDTFDKLTQAKGAVTRAENENERERDRKIRNSSLSEVMSAIDEAYDSWSTGVLRQHARSLQRNGAVHEAIARLQESLMTLTGLFNSDLTTARDKLAATARVAHAAKAEAAAVSMALKDRDKKIEALQMAAAEMNKEMMKIKKEKEEVKEEMMKMRKEKNEVVMVKNEVVMVKAELSSAHSVIKTVVLDLQQERAHLQKHLERLSTRVKEEQAEVVALRESFAKESKATASMRERERTVQVKAVGLLQDQSAASIVALRARLKRHEQAELALKGERDTQAAELRKMQADHAREMEEHISVKDTHFQELTKLYSSNTRAGVQRVRDSCKSGPVIGSDVELLQAGSSGMKSPLPPQSEISTILGFWGLGARSASTGSQERTKRMLCLSCGKEFMQAITESGLHYCDNCQPADPAWKQEELLPPAIQPMPIGGEDPPSSSVPSYISPRKPSRALSLGSHHRNMEVLNSKPRGDARGDGSEGGWEGRGDGGGGAGGGEKVSTQQTGGEERDATSIASAGGAGMRGSNDRREQLEGGVRVDAVIRSNIKGQPDESHHQLHRGDVLLRVNGKGCDLKRLVSLSQQPRVQDSELKFLVQKEQQEVEILAKVRLMLGATNCCCPHTSKSHPFAHLAGTHGGGDQQKTGGGGVCMEGAEAVSWGTCMTGCAVSVLLSDGSALLLVSTRPSACLCFKSGEEEEGELLL